MIFHLHSCNAKVKLIAVVPKIYVSLMKAVPPPSNPGMHEPMLPKQAKPHGEPISYAIQYPSACLGLNSKADPKAGASEKCYCVCGTHPF